jgi:hypothetical protein
MKIIKYGTMPNNQVRSFVCKKCGTLFQATAVEYQRAMEIYTEDKIKYKCRCPLCNLWVYDIGS